MDKKQTQYRVYGFALIEPQVNILMDMLKYAKEVYMGGAEPLPDMVKLMDNVIVELDKQIKNQPDYSKPEKKGGLINED